jgi:hypothetical protein
MRSIDELLCIIHDKMDHAKIAFLRLQIYNKMISGLGQLPIILTCMITHGHKDKRYAHYQMSCGQMIAISQLGPCCGSFALQK